MGAYARQASGGATIGPRRFGPAYQAGADLVRALVDLSEGGTGKRASGADLRELVGRPLEEAAQEIARAIAPENADADQVTIAIQEALIEVLPPEQVFDPTLLDEERLARLIVEFLSRIVFLEITSAAGDAWNKAEGARATKKLENALFELIRVAVDKHLAPRIAEGISGLSRAAIAKVQRAALVDVWAEWEQLE